MEIPKHTTQIGEIEGNYKIFIEDYVISYMKQLCRQEPNCKKRIAFYGVKRTEQEQEYFFVYGGSRINIHEKDDYHLDTGDYEEMIWAGEKYFDTYVSLGYVTIEEELPEGIFIFCGGKEKYVKGYHIFYEKNDSMLTYLIARQNDNTKEDMQSESEQTLYREISTEKDSKDSILKELYPTSHLREQRLRENKESTAIGEIKLFGIVKSVAAALLIVLCVTAISTMNGLGKIESVQNYFQRAFREIKEKKIPDREEVIPASNEIKRVNTISDNESENESKNESENVSDNESKTVNDVSANETEETTTVSESANPNDDKQTEVSQSHVIEKGETLISISRMFYGDDSKVRAICELNGIANSDNIQVGQKIILP